MKKRNWPLAILIGMVAASLQAQPSVQTIVTNDLAEPYGITVDLNNNYYLTDSAHNRILKYAPTTGQVSSFAGTGTAGSTDNAIGILADFFNPQGIAYDSVRDLLFVADSGNHSIRRITMAGQVTTVAGTPGVTGDNTSSAFNTPVGLAVDGQRNLYVADLANNSVRRVDDAGNITLLADGFLRPTALAIKLDSAGAAAELYVADTGNHSIKKLTPPANAGDPWTVELMAGSDSRIQSGSQDSLVASNARFHSPRGLVYVPADDEIVVSDTGNGLIRRVFFNPLVSTWSVEQFIAPADNLTAPIGIAVDVNGNFPVVDLAADTLNIIQLTAPQEPIVEPEIGEVLYRKDPFGELLTSLEHTPSATFNGDAVIAVDRVEDNVQSFFTFDSGADFSENRDKWLPAPPYEDGMRFFNQSIVTSNIIATLGPTIRIKAISTATGRRPSSEVSATYRFVVSDIEFLDGVDGFPISPDPNEGSRKLNPLSIVMKNETPGARIWYTIDGTDPAPNGPTSFLYTPGTELNLVEAVFTSPNQTIELKVNAFRLGFDSSATLVTEELTLDNLIATQVGFFSDFVGGPGATVVVPVSINLDPGKVLQSLQFRVEVTPDGAAPPISTQFRHVPIGTNDFISIPLPSTNAPIANVYADGNTTGIEFAYLDHQGGLELTGEAIVALFAIPIPASAQDGQTYTLAVRFPSGTSDGFQTPVYITEAVPRKLTVGSIPYLVGDSAQASGYNAGSFGNHNLNNNDVNNAFNASIGIRAPFSFTDVFDAMDAFPVDFISVPGTPAPAGGDGQIRFLDWQTILQRSLRRDPNPPNPGDLEVTFERFWDANGNRSVTTAQMIGIPNQTAEEISLPAPGVVWVRQAMIKASDVEGVGIGATVEVPIDLEVDPGMQVAGLQFRAQVVPSEGAPRIQTPVAFVAASGLPLSEPRTLHGLQTPGLPVNNVASAWSLPTQAKDSALRGTQRLGTVRFQVPADAQPGDCYTVRFLNADGSPDFRTQFDFETLSGTVCVAAELPNEQPVTSDEWRSHFFGKLDSRWADPDLDPDGDQMSNWQEYLEGKDPTELKFHALLEEWRGDAAKRAFKLQWFTKAGKQYRILRSGNLSNWETVADQIAGLDDVKQILDRTRGSGSVFYKVMEEIPSAE